jgi:hypothetical protein
MNNPKPTIGQAIDQILAALTALDKREQQTVLSTVCAFLELDARAVPGNAGLAASAPAAPAARNSPEALRANASRVMDIRALKEEKRPDSARQMACIVAYYLMEHAPENEKKETVNSADIERLFKQANFKLPTKLEQLLIDCKKSGYVEVVTRGEYKLTRVGYNLVTHAMPKGAKA